MKGKISEVFESVQGEGLYCGQRQLFVRLFGCNLASCKFCDTKLNYFIEYTAEELAEKINSYNNYDAVSFTGGEPLLQKDFLKEVLAFTNQRGLKSYLETNGTLPDELQEVIGYVDIVSMDLKLPSSTGLADFWGQHRKFLKIASQKNVFLKAVICESTTEKDLMDAIALIKEINSAVALVLQPNFYEESYSLYAKIEKFKGICVDNNIAVCVIAQVHKFMGVR